MEVTNKNFKESLGIISDAISKAEFLAIDGEFTGLSTPGVPNIHSFDTPEERYHKLRKGGVDFLLMQFGLCTFQYDSEKNRYITKAFNFYIFPRPFSKQAPDIRFLSQSSSIDFLISQGFDFNKVFRHGISYLLPADEQRIRESLHHKHQQSSLQFSSPAFTSPNADPSSIMKGPSIVPDEHKEYINSVCAKIEEFLNQTDTESLSLAPTNGYLRKLVYQTVAQRIRSGVHLETKTGEKRERFIIVTRVRSDDEVRNKEESKQAAELQELEDAVGFSKIIRMITESKKLVVGHNMLLDVLHVLHQFASPLPEDYEEFKSLVQCVFPRLLDTKLMASTHPFKEQIVITALGDMQKILSCKPFPQSEIVTEEGFPSYSTSSEQLHEAGYDAFITGVCFLTMANHLGKFQKPPTTRVPSNSQLVEPFMNKLFMMKVPDIPYMNLKEADLTPDRDHVFHVSFPKEWKTSDLLELFGPFGHVNIAWLNDTSAFVGLSKREQVDILLKTLMQGETYKVTQYSEYMKHKDEPAQRSRKRSLAKSDYEPECKKTKVSLNVEEPESEATPFISKLSPIAEERSVSKLTSGADSDYNGLGPAEDIGVPVSKKNEKSETTEGKDANGKSGGDVMFTVPDSW